MKSTYEDQKNQKKTAKLTNSRVMESSLNLKMAKLVGLYCPEEKLLNSAIKVE